MVPIVIVLICVAWRILVRRKQEERDENEFMTINRSRPIDPDESMKINSDDESIPYKKDIEEDSPEPTDPVRVVDSDQFPDAVRVADSSQPFTYGQPPPPPTEPVDQTRRQWAGETEIN